MNGDVEKLKELLQYSNDSLEDVIYLFMRTYPNEFDAMRINSLICKLNSEFLFTKITRLEHIKSVSREKATYLNKFLKGEMYADEKSAKENIGCQIEHTQTIIDFCRDI